MSEDIIMEKKMATHAINYLLTKSEVFMGKS